MSQLYVDNIRNRTGGPIGIPTGAVVTGVITATTANVTGNMTVGGVLTYEDVTNIDSVGVITARSGIEFGASGVGGTITATGQAEFVGIVTARSGIQVGASGVGGTITSVGNAEFVGLVTAKSGLRVPGGTATSNRVELGNSQEFTIQYNTSSTKGIISAASNPIDIQATTIKLLPNVGENGVIVNQNGAVDLYHDNALKLSTASIGATVTGSLLVGAGQSFGSIDGATAVYYGDGSNLTGISAGISSSQSAPSANTVVTLNLGTAQHHELNLAAGITTITCTGGNPGESHSIVLTQPSSGITTVGFSTYFLFPSGSIPSMSEGSSKVDLVSFVIKRVGTVVGVAATELLASAGLNYSN